MAMVGIRIVRMRMNQRRVCVPVGVRLAPVPAWGVGMLMMLVMDVSVRVFLSGMRMQVFVPLGKMKPDARRHQYSRSEKLHRQDIALQ